MEASGQLHSWTALSPGKNTRYPVDRRLGGTHDRFGRGGEREVPAR
jgi:hypothetical protein